MPLIIVHVRYLLLLQIDHWAYSTSQPSLSQFVNIVVNLLFGLVISFLPYVYVDVFNGLFARSSRNVPKSFYFLHIMINYRSPSSEPFLELLIRICEMNIDIILEYLTSSSSNTTSLIAYSCMNFFVRASYSIGRPGEMLVFNFSSFWFCSCSCFSYHIFYLISTFCVLACDAAFLGLIRLCWIVYCLENFPRSRQATSI